MEAADIKKIREFVGELAQYKKMYAELAHENDAIKGVIAKKALTSSERLDVAVTLVDEYDLSIYRYLPI